MTIQELVAEYLVLRAEKEDLVRKHKLELDALNVNLGTIETSVLARMQEEGVTSYKTAIGTAYKVQSDYANVADWNVVLDHVRENDLWELLDKRVNKIAVRNLIEEGKIPPGINYGTRLDINIRRS